MDWWFIVYVVLVVVAVLGIRSVPENGRLVVVRLGKPCHVVGPGLRYILPFLNRVYRVDLETTIPEWQTLSEADIAQRLIHLAQTGMLGAQPS